MSQQHDAVRVWQDIMKDATDQIIETFDKRVAEKDAEISELKKELAKMKILQKQEGKHFQAKLGQAKELEDKAKAAHERCELQNVLINTLLDRNKCLEKELYNQKKSYSALKSKDKKSATTPLSIVAEDSIENSIDGANFVLASTSLTPAENRRNIAALPGDPVKNQFSSNDFKNEYPGDDASTIIIGSEIEENDSDRKRIQNFQFATNNERPSISNAHQPCTWPAAGTSTGLSDPPTRDSKYFTLSAYEDANEAGGPTATARLSSSVAGDSCKAECGCDQELEDDDVKHHRQKYEQNFNSRSHLDWHLHLQRKEKKQANDPLHTPVSQDKPVDLRNTM